MTNQTPSTQIPVKPLLTPEQMERILSSRRSITSEEAYRQMELHLGRNKGWRKAVRFALTENPVSLDHDVAHESLFTLLREDRSDLI